MADTSKPIDVREGQYVITAGRWGFSVYRADKVTEKQIRSRRYGTRYNHVDRLEVIGAFDTREAASATMDKLDDARRDSRRRESAIDANYRQQIAPFEKARDEKIAAERERYDALIRDLVGQAA